jgi:protein tyrosine phosphatase (PTP) superfamily phosphohydrolase (DUF442 family)
MPSLLDALAGVPNAAQPLPNVVTGGQPGPAHFQALRRAGLEIVLDIRDPMEPRACDEASEVRKAGMDYVCIPVTSDLGDELMEELLAVVRGSAGRPILFHCASGNRVAGPMIAHLILDHGMAEEDAVTEGMKMGLRSAEIMDWGTDYARRKKKAGGS